MAIGLLLLMTTGAVADPDDNERPPQYACKHEPGLVEVTFKPDTKIEDVITWAMGFTCRSFLYDQRVMGRKVSIMAPEKMSAAAAYRVFEAALATTGLTVVDKDGVVKIVELQTARHEAVAIAHNGGAGLDARDELVRVVFRPAYASADAIVKAFTAIKSDAGEVVALGGGIVLVTDFAGSVKEMTEMAKLVDVPAGSDAIYTIAIEHADAKKLVDVIEPMLGMSTTPGGLPAAGGKGAPDAPAAPSSGAAPSKMMVEDRTNTIVLAGTAAAYDRVYSLVKRLDISLDVEGGQAIHVVQLHSAIAEEMAATLTSAITNGTTGLSAGSAAGKPGAPAAPAAAAPTSVDNVGLTVEGKVKVIADKASNKLIVMSSGRDYLAVRDVIRDLDTPRREVFIDAQILEVSLSNETDVGAAGHGILPSTDGTNALIGGVELPQLSSTNTSALSSATGLIAGVIGSQLSGSTSLLGISIPSYAVLVNALATDSNTNLLSAPSIIALDNDEAKFKVGTNIPYKRGVTITPVSASNAGVTTSIDRQDLTLELDIKPHITDGDIVMLEVKHDAKDLGENLADLGPEWTTRSFETKLMVRDQQTVVIGGLMEEREVRTVAKVPVLGDIPVLGYLFKYDTKQKKKTSLLIVLTPYIIRDQSDLERIRERKQREHDELTRSFAVLNHAKYEPGVDYTRKRGLVEEIDRVEGQIDDDRAARAALPTADRVDSGPVSSTARPSSGSRTPDAALDASPDTSTLDTQGTSR
jgi:general secretion pathway protein D